MKTRAIIFAALVLACCAFADEGTNSLPEAATGKLTVPVAPVIVTNWVTADPSFREVDGQLYNTKRSVKFKPFNGECEAVFFNGIILRQVTEFPIYGERRSDPLVGSGNFLGSSGETSPAPIIGYQKIYGERIFILNFLADQQLAPGSRQAGVAMYKGTIKFGGDTLELWDWGKPHVVRVVVTNWPAAYLRQVQAEVEQARRAAATTAILKHHQPKAEAGDGFAQLRLGEIYLRGEGVETNTALARKWLTAAVTNGYPQATNSLIEIEGNLDPK